MKRTVTAGGRRIEYTLVQTNRRNLMCKVLPEGEVRVYAPRRTRLLTIDDFVRANAADIARWLVEIERRAAAGRAAHPMTDGSSVLVEGKLLPLRLSAGALSFQIVDGEIRLCLPRPDDPDAVRQALRKELSALALVRIRDQLSRWAPRVGMPYGRVTIREQKTRWGSCSSRHNLNFNWKLVMAPPEALGYVVLHELCHLREFSHSPKFWKLVKSLMPEYEIWKKWLKDHGSELTLG